MDKRIEKQLKKLDIEADSQLGKFLIKLDKTYDELDNIDDKIKYCIDRRQQIKEDIEMMELMLMHKINKDSRLQKWESYR